MNTIADKRDLPLFIHSVIDDMTELSPNALRVYMHLSRRADKEGKAWPSYQAIGDHCFASVSDNPATRKTFARKAIDDLIAAKLIVKEERERDDGSQTSNAYVLINPSLPIDIPVLISTSLPIDIPMLTKAAPVLNEQPPCLSSTEDTLIEDTPLEEKGEEEDTRAREPLALAWQQAYNGDIPENLETQLRSLAKETSVAAVIHGIKTSAKKDSRNFRYIAECARNYVPSVNGNGYHAYSTSVDIAYPGVHTLVSPSTVNGHASPPLPPPVDSGDPWASAMAELTGVLPGSSPRWLEGSRLEENGELAGEPLYRIVLTNPQANTQWLTQQAEPAIRKKLASILRKRILLEFVHEGVTA